MDGFDWFALASAAAAAASAIWAGIQGRAAKRQAASAEHQVELSKKQLEEMRRANELAERIRQEEREAQKLRLEVTAKPTQDAKDKAVWWLDVTIENNSFLSLPPSVPRPARQTRPCFSRQEEGHLRSWMLLAPA